MEVDVLSSSIRNFIRDESGGYTVWSLFWFAVYVAMGGLAVDVTDAYRTQTQLQSTVDAAALAGVMSLPDKVEAVGQAVGYAEFNMAVDLNGHVLSPSEVYTGNWDTSTHTFTKDGEPLNAVYALARRATQNENPLATNFLNIIGLRKFDVNVDAVALTFVPECLLHNGFVAGNKVSIQGGNSAEFACFHGQNMTVDTAHQDLSVSIANGNTFGEGAVVSMPDLGGLTGRNNLCQQNPTLCDPGVLVEGDMWPDDVKNIGTIIGDLRYGKGPYTPDYMSVTDPQTGNVISPPTIYTGDPTRPDIDGVTVQYDPKYDDKFAGPYLPHSIYDIRCKSQSNLLGLSAAQPLIDVVIVADCKVKGGAGGTLERGVIATSAVGSTSNGTELLTNTVDLPSNWSFGLATDFCNGGTGKVAIYAAASVSISANAGVYGLRVLAGGDLTFTANGDVYGISAEAGNNIQASTSNGDFKYCGGTYDIATFAPRYRLVR